jgi:hypothetical protein
LDGNLFNLYEKEEGEALKRKHLIIVEGMCLFQINSQIITKTPSPVCSINLFSFDDEIMTTTMMEERESGDESLIKEQIRLFYISET